MKTYKTILFILMILSIFLIRQNAPFAAEKDPGHRTLVGTVEKITSNSIFVKTKEGTRNFSVSTAEIDLAKVKVGDQVELQFNEQNMIIDIDKVTLGEAGGHDVHKKIAGTLLDYDRVQKTAMIKIKGGQQKSFKLKDAAATKMVNIKPGTEIVIDIDEENGMAMEVHVR